MKGLELAKSYYEEYGRAMLFESFPELLPYIAVGLVGSGSECLGFDDELSKDHDFEPGFCILLPDEYIVDRKKEFALERAYSKLPSEFMGYKRSLLAPVGGKRHGVMRFNELLLEKTGDRNGSLSLEDFIMLPEQALLEATGGEIFYDGLGEFSKIRESIAYLPEDVRRKKLAGHLLNMAQSGQYNYQRCISRGESAASQLALYEFVKSGIHTIFLLNKRYLPYYKWCFKALKELPVLSYLHGDLEYLISSANSKSEVARKTELVEKVSGAIISALITEGVTSYDGTELEGHAYSVNDHISDLKIRNMHILCAL